MAERLPHAVEEAFGDIRRLEPDPQVVREAIARTRRPLGRQRRRRTGLALAIAALVAGGSAIAATGGRLGIVEGFGDVGTRHSHGDEHYAFTYESPNYAVAELRVRHFGRVRLTYRRSSIGDCHGIQLLDQRPPADTAPLVGGRWRPSLAEGCGDSSTFRAAVAVDGDWGLIRGRAPETARAVRITARGRDLGPAQLVRNAGKIPYVAFVAVVPRAGLCDVRAVADDPTLPQVGGIDVPGFSPCRRQVRHERRWRRPN
jgi:hypothetical protein